MHEPEDDVAEYEDDDAEGLAAGGFGTAFAGARLKTTIGLRRSGQKGEG